MRPNLMMLPASEIIQIPYLKYICWVLVVRFPQGFAMNNKVYSQDYNYRHR